MSGIDSDRPSRLPAYPLLDGHKRKKKRLVPVLNDLAQVSFVNTLDSIVPEVLWIGGAIEKFGLKKSIEIVTKFLKSLWSMKIEGPPEFFRFSVLCKVEYREIVSNAAGYDELGDVFAVFAAFYGEEWAPNHAGNITYDEAGKIIEKWVGTYWNRFEQPFLLIGATIMYSLAKADRMKFASASIPDLNALAQSIESAEGMMAASFVRASLMAFFPQSADSQSSDWCKKFWDENYKYSDCEFYA